MAAAAGCSPLIHMTELAYMGFGQVISHLPGLYNNLKKAREAVKAVHPDALILIDYPSFNLKVAETAFKARIPIFYYISPKLWAWKKWRLRDIKRMVRRVFSILPFEPNSMSQMVLKPHMWEIRQWRRLTGACSRDSHVRSSCARTACLISRSLPLCRAAAVVKSRPTFR